MSITTYEDGSGCPVRDIYQDPAFSKNPFHGLEQLRESPIWWQPRGGGSWVITRDGDIRAVLQNADLFSNASTPVLAGAGAWPRPLLPQQTDAPEHGRYRSWFIRHLTHGTAELISAAVGNEVVRRVEHLSQVGCCDLVEDLARPMQNSLFASLYHTSADTAEACATWAHTFLHDESGEARAKAAANLADCLNGLTAEQEALAPEKRARGIVSTLLAPSPTGERLSHEEILDMLMMMAVASLDTVANTLATSIYRLAGDPEARHVYATAAETGRLTEEMLRLDAVAVLMRVAIRDTQLCGVRIRAHDRILIFPALANTDPHRYPAPADIDHDRPIPTGHLAFGTGPHRCVGAAIARRVLDTALREIHQRIPDYTIAPNTEIDFGGRTIILLHSLPLTW